MTDKRATYDADIRKTQRRLATHRQRLEAELAPYYGDASAVIDTFNALSDVHGSRYALTQFRADTRPDNAFHHLRAHQRSFPTPSRVMDADVAESIEVSLGDHDCVRLDLQWQLRRRDKLRASLRNPGQAPAQPIAAQPDRDR